jgi:Raf kinase inhibitor-like YbhB/YbcL family protein
MLQNLPAGLGRALRTARPGLENILFYDPELNAEVGTLEVSSSEFQNFAEIPIRFTEDGEKISPPIQWGSVPQETQSLILVIEDADSPTPAPLVHAIVWNLSPSAGRLEAGALRSCVGEGQGLAMGKNSFMSARYLAPDPPPGHGPHRYAFQLFALDSRPDLGSNPGRSAKGLMIGTFERL